MLSRRGFLTGLMASAMLAVTTTTRLACPRVMSPIQRTIDYVREKAAWQVTDWALIDGDMYVCSEYFDEPDFDTAYMNKLSRLGFQRRLDVLNA